MLVRGDSLGKGMSQYLIDQIARDAQHRGPHLHQVAEAHGEEHLERSTSCTPRPATGQTEPVRASLFIFIGAQPRTDWLAGVVERDERGFILTGPDLMPRRQRPAGLEPRTATLPAGDQRAGRLRRRRRAPRLGQARGLRRRRGLDRHLVRPPVSGEQLMTAETGDAARPRQDALFPRLARASPGARARRDEPSSSRAPCCSRGDTDYHFFVRAGRGGPRHQDGRQRGALLAVHGPGEFYAARSRC